MTIINRANLKKTRVALRRKATKAEIMLWSKLRGKQLSGLKFRRQVSIGKYVLDFFCPQLRLAIEVDGESHFTTDGKMYDKERTIFLQQFRIRLMRITNEEVLSNLEGVWAKLEHVTTELTPHYPPFPRGDSARAKSRMEMSGQLVSDDETDEDLS